MKPSDSTLRPENDREGVLQEEFTPATGVVVGAVGMVATTYFYFLSFAQFGFLQRVQQVAGDDDQKLRLVTGLMALAGIAGSVGAAYRYSEARSPRMILGSYLVCALAAGGSLLAGNLQLLALVAVATGAGIGVGTVTLASCLRRVIGGQRLGSVLGLGTGLAYGLVNLPPVIRSGPTGLAVFALVAACLGSLAVQGVELRAPGHRPAGSDYQPTGIFAWVAVFLALVWLDSAAFFIIQHNPDRWAATWGSDSGLYANAVVHAVAALLAGHALDRRWVGRSIMAATGLLLVACLFTGRQGEGTDVSSLLYVGGVSIYSTILIFYPARSGRPLLAALVYAVAGWGGSALGIGMAQHLHEIPRWLVLAAGALVGGAMVVRGLVRRRERRGP
jgi:cytochrome c oxidase cbb3-type subunit 2